MILVARIIVDKMWQEVRCTLLDYSHSSSSNRQWEVVQYDVMGLMSMRMEIRMLPVVRTIMNKMQ